MKQIWRPVPGWENLYEVSNHGYVRGLRRGRIMKGWSYNKYGHQQVTLSDRPRRIWPVQVHKLVLLAFVGPPPEGYETRHYPDRNPANNRLDNLSWAPRDLNTQDRAEHGTNANGERSYNAKLTWTKVREIRKRAGLFTQRELAGRYGTHQSTIWKILHDLAWKE